MTTSFATTDSFEITTTTSQSSTTRRSALYLKSQGESVFCWLHHCDEEPCLDHGVIICPPTGYEQVHSHRSLRHLADAIARNRIPTVRIDYSGTGDSAGFDEEPKRVETWIANIRDAIRWMRQELGCTHVSLLGLRMGATLATLAAIEQQIDNLILWSPVVKGRAYVREMKALSLTVDADLAWSAEPNGNIESAGFVLSKETADAISQIDLLKIEPRCRRALLVNRDDVATETRLLDHFAALGIAAEQIALPDYLDMMAVPHETKVPQGAIRSIAEWLSASVDDESMSVGLPDLKAISSTVANVSSHALRYSHWPAERPLREKLCQISDKPDLFGILTEPAANAPTDLPLVVLLNAGSAYRIGPGRLHVLLARQLAAAGFRVLRMDLGGLGDSVAENPALENDSYAATAFRDIDLTLKYAEDRLGAHKAILIGLCSGAYDAFQAAVQFSNPILVESVLINPLTYFWQDGMTIETAASNQLISWHYYLTAFFSPRKWRGLFAGKSHLGVRGAIKRLAKWPLKSKPAQGTRSVAKLGKSSTSPYGHPLRQNLPGDLARVAAADRHLALICSTSDPGHFILMFQARRKANQLRRAGRLNVFFIKGADHTFSKSASRQELIQTTADYLCRRYQA